MEAKKLEDYTYEDYLDIARSTKERVELIFGKIYMMAGAGAIHQDVVLNIAVALKKKADGCKPRIAPYDLKLMCEYGAKNRVNVVQPDVMLFCGDELRPCAIFEVLSPSTAYKDKQIKKELYECAGIREYFIVEPEYCLIEKFVLEEGRYRYAGSFKDRVTIECLGDEVDVREFFEGIECAAE
jgi:Uma2 family endonuclease